jgi:hypothetical protein
MRVTFLVGIVLLFQSVFAQIQGDSFRSSVDEVLTDTVVEFVGELPSDSLVPTDSILRFNAADYDFGEIKKGEKVKHTFNFHFAGHDSLIITDVSVDCGCTVPNLDKYIYAPGESGQIEVVYDSKDDVGRVLQYITVLHNIGKGYTFLTISGFVLTRF